MTTILDPTKSYKTKYTKTYLDSVDPNIYTFLTGLGYTNGSATVVSGDYLDGVLLGADQTEPDVVLDAEGEQVCFVGLNGCGAGQFTIQDKTIACGGDVTPADAVAQYNPVHKDMLGNLWAKVGAATTSGRGSVSASNTTNTNINVINTPFYRSETADVSYINNTCRPMVIYITYYATVSTLLNANDRLEVKLQMSYDGGGVWSDALREAVRLTSTALEFPHSMTGATTTVIAPGATWTSRGRVCVQSLAGTGSWHLTSNLTVVQIAISQ